LLADSSILDWHPNSNAVAQQAENLIRIRKDWTAYPTARPHNQGANLMLPNENNHVPIEKECISLWFLKTNYTPLNQEREKRQNTLRR
jgi:hypothetical protein